MATAHTDTHKKTADHVKAAAHAATNAKALSYAAETTPPEAPAPAADFKHKPNPSMEKRMARIEKLLRAIGYEPEHYEDDASE